MEVTNTIEKESENFSTHKYLAPIEHIVIGSTTIVAGKTFGTEDFIRKIGEGGLGSDYRIPPTVGTEGVEAVIANRAAVHLDGALALFTVAQVDVMFDLPNAAPSFFLGQLDEYGLVGDSFKVGIINTKTGELDHPELLDKLILNDNFAKFFTMNRNDNYYIISPKVQIFK